MQRIQLDILKKKPLTNQDVHQYLQACMQIWLVRMTDQCRANHLKLLANKDTINEAIFREIFIRHLFGGENGEIENELLKHPTKLATRDLFLHFKYCLRKHWSLIRHSPKLHYQYRPDLWINRVCIQLALLCEAGLGESCASLLYPELQDTRNEATDFSAVDTSRLAELPPVQANVVISECGKYFIEVDTCFELLKQHGELRHTQVDKPLSELEKKSVLELTRYASTAYETYTEWYKLHISEVSVGGCIAVLIRNLRDGGAHRDSLKNRTGVESMAGEQALNGIAIFAEIINKLPEAMRSKLFAMQSGGDNFAYYFNLMCARDQCVETSANNLSRFLDNHRDALYNMTIDRCEGVSKQIATLDRRYNENLSDLYHYFEVIYPYLMADDEIRSDIYPDTIADCTSQFSDAIYIAYIIQWLATDFKNQRLINRIEILCGLFEKQPLAILESELLSHMTEESLRLLMEHFCGKFFKPILSAIDPRYKLEIDIGKDFYCVLYRCNDMYVGKHATSGQKNRAMTNLARLYFTLPNYNPLLISNGYDVLVFAAEKNNADLVAYLLSKGASTKSHDFSDMRHAIVYAIKNRHINCTKILIPTLNQYDDSILESVLSWSNIQVMNLLFNRYVAIGQDSLELAEICFDIASNNLNSIALQFALEKGAKRSIEMTLTNLCRKLWHKCLGLISKENCVNQVAYREALQSELSSCADAQILNVILAHSLHSEEPINDSKKDLILWILQHIDIESFADIIKYFRIYKLTYKGLFYLVDLMTCAQRQHLMQCYFDSIIQVIRDYLPIQHRYLVNDGNWPLLLQRIIEIPAIPMRISMIMLLIHHPDIRVAKLPFLHFTIPGEPFLFDLFISEMRMVDINLADELGNTVALRAATNYRFLPRLKKLVELKAALYCINHLKMNIFHAASHARIETIIYLLETEFPASLLSDTQVPDTINLSAFNKSCKKRMLLAVNNEGITALSMAVNLLRTLHEKTNDLLQLLVDTVGLETLFFAIDHLGEKSISRLLNILNKTHNSDTLAKNILMAGAANVATIFFNDMVKLDIEFFEKAYVYALERLFELFIKRANKTDIAMETRSVIRSFLLTIKNLPKFYSLTKTELALLYGGEVTAETIPALLVERVLSKIATMLMITNINRFLLKHADNRQLLFIMASYFHLMTPPQRQCFVEEYYPDIEDEMFAVNPNEDMNWDNKLHELVASGAPRSKIVLLLQKKHAFDANYTSLNAKGNSTLHLAIGCPETLKEILIACHYHIDITNDRNETPLDVAVCRDSIESAGLLLKYGANPTLSCYAGCQLSPLMLAAKIGSAQIFHLILAHIANSKNALIETNEQGESALSFACASSDYRLLVGITFSRSYLNQINPITKKSLLMCAASAGRLSNAAILIKTGCQIDLANDEGKTASEFALEAGHTALAAFLDFVQRQSLQTQMNANDLCQENITADDSVITFIAAHSKRVNDDNYLLAVRLAARCGRVKMLIILLRNKNCRIQDDILHAAKSYQHTTRDIILAVITRKLLHQLLTAMNKEDNSISILSLFKSKEDRLKAVAFYDYVKHLMHRMTTFIKQDNTYGYRFEERVIAYVTAFKSGLILGHVCDKRLAKILTCALGKVEYETLLNNLEKQLPNIKP